MANRVQFRRGTAADATAENPILAEGEQGYETDTARSKIGDGSTAWNDLDYMNPGPTGPPGDASLPVGFVYFQLPGKLSPSDLSLTGTWSNVSTSWPGDFLRIEGGNASTFNSGQQANQNKTHTHVQNSHIHTMPTHRHNSGWVLASNSGSYNVYGVRTVTTQGNSLGGSTNSGPYAAYTSTDDPGDTYSKIATNQTEGGIESWPNNRTIRVWERIS